MKLLFFLTAAPYSGQTAATALKLAAEALTLGHSVNIFASGDGVYGFAKGQKVAGVFDVIASAEAILSRGGEVHL